MNSKKKGKKKLRTSLTQKAELANHLACRPHWTLISGSIEPKLYWVRIFLENSKKRLLGDAHNWKKNNMNGNAWMKKGSTYLSLSTFSAFPTDSLSLKSGVFCGGFLQRSSERERWVKENYGQIEELELDHRNLRKVLSFSLLLFYIENSRQLHEGDVLGVRNQVNNQYSWSIKFLVLHVKNV